MASFLTNSDTSLRRAEISASSLGTCATRYTGHRGGLEVNSNWYPDCTMLVTQLLTCSTAALPPPPCCQTPGFS